MNSIKTALNSIKGNNISQIKMIKYVGIRAYGTGIALGGAIGFFEGIYKGYNIIDKREKIKLQESFKNYEYLLNGMYDAGTYAICGTSTAFSSMVIVALFPVSIPILLQYKEKEN
jgi:hypothetical protein